MNILGIADGLDAGAALLVDDRVVAVASEAEFRRTARVRAMPWRAMDAVLAAAGLQPVEVDRVAVAGRFTPPMVVRQRPELRQLSADAFSPALDGQEFVQALLRQTGFGAVEADLAEEWFAEELARYGVVGDRVRLLDIHAVLANLAYRTFDGRGAGEAVTVACLHGLGDGVAASVFVGHLGSLERRFEQRGTTALHTHLLRCRSAIGLDPWVDDARLWSLAASGQPNEGVVRRLRAQLDVERGQLSRRAYRLGTRDPVYQEIGKLPPADAAASVALALQETVLAWLDHHAPDRAAPLALAGEVFDNPRLVSALLATRARVHLPPLVGFSGLPVGAALAQGGAAPRRLGDTLRPLCVLPEVAPFGRPSSAERWLLRVVQGVPVARFSGFGIGAAAAGERSVLVRADDPAAIRLARRAVGRPEEEEGVLLLPQAEVERRLPSLSCGQAFGAVALNVGGDPQLARAGGADGRVPVHGVPSGSPLAERLEALTRLGVPALLAFPLGHFRDPAAATLEDVQRLWDGSALAALDLDGLVVERA